MIQATDVTLDLDANGKAALTIEAVDQGSTDNCGIESRELQYSDFGCTDTGDHTVLYTVRDKAGNAATRAIKVTVRDITAPVAQAQDLIVELDGSGNALLEAAAINDGSYDNCAIAVLSLSQSAFTCVDLGKRLVTLTVKDDSGNESTARAEVLIRDSEGVCPCSYGVLAEEKITLRSNEVHAGGIGATSEKGTVKLRHTVVKEEGTFVKSPRTRFDSGSESSVYMSGRAPQPESFRSNGHKDRKKEKIKKGETRTFTAGRYGRIRGGRGAKLIFEGGGEVYIRSLKVKKSAEVSFTGPTAVLIRNGVRLGKAVEFNGAGEQVRLYSGGNISVGNGSELKGYFHGRERLKSRSGGSETLLEGFFAARQIKGGRNTHWSGGGVLCVGNENETLTAGEKGVRTKTQSEAEIKADTVVQGAGLRVVLWPNPVRDRLRVDIVSEAEGGELTLVDLPGNVLRKTKFSSRAETVELQTKHLSPGLYVLRVQSGKEAVTLRVVKNE